MKDGFAECCIGNCLDEDLLDVQPWVGQQIRTVFRIKHWYGWKDVAANAEPWMMEVGDFGKFCIE